MYHLLEGCPPHLLTYLQTYWFSEITFHLNLPGMWINWRLTVLHTYITSLENKHFEQKPNLTSIIVAISE